VKSAVISGIKRANIWTIKLMSLQNNKNNIRDLYRGINEFKRGYQPQSNLENE
jgi:hypothetical protein